MDSSERLAVLPLPNTGDGADHCCTCTTYHVDNARAQPLQAELANERCGVVGSTTAGGCSEGSDERDRTRRLGSGQNRKKYGSRGIVGKDVCNLEAGPLDRRDRRVAGADAVAAFVVMIAGGAVIMGMVRILVAVLPRSHPGSQDPPLSATEIDQTATREHPLGNEAEENGYDEYGGGRFHRWVKVGRT